MSEAHIPQPNSEGPAEQFTSVESNMVMPTISPIAGSTGPSPAEVSKHVIASNNVDMYLHTQFIPTDQLTWGTTDARAKLLWFAPIHPGFANRQVRYLYEMYNAWGGGLDFNFKIAGTGFHAGALAVVRLPPNIHPRDLDQSDKFGVFEYQVWDPKTIPIFSIHVPDQRQVMYHYKPFDETNVNSFGGYVAIFVLMPLVTSSTGVNQINVQVFNKLAEDFQFSQMMPVLLHGGPTNDPDYLNDIFDFQDRSRIVSYGGLSVNNIVVRPSQETQIQDYNYNVIGLDGSKWDNRSGFNGALNGQCILAHQNTTTYFFQSYGIGPVKSRYGSVSFSRTENLKNQVRADGILTLTPTVTSGKIEIQLSKSSDDPTMQVGDSIFITANGLTINDLNVKSPIFVPPVNESTVSFNGAEDVDGVFCPQTTSMSSSFLRQNIRLPTGMCCLLQLFDYVEQLPVMYLKLYTEGFITARATSDRLIFPVDRYKLVFDSYISRIDNIPSSPLSSIISRMSKMVNKRPF
jgi:hypothetical protein